MLEAYVINLSWDLLAAGGVSALWYGSRVLGRSYMTGKPGFRQIHNFGEMSIRNAFGNFRQRNYNARRGRGGTSAARGVTVPNNVRLRDIGKNLVTDVFSSAFAGAVGAVALEALRVGYNIYTNGGLFFGGWTYGPIVEGLKRIF